MIDYNDYNNDIYESITIRISDHSPTGSGSLCDAYIYIQDKEWGIIRKEVFEVFEKFITLTTGRQKYILKHVPDSNKKLDVKLPKHCSIRKKSRRCQNRRQKCSWINQSWKWLKRS